MPDVPVVDTIIPQKVRKWNGFFGFSHEDSAHGGRKKAGTGNERIPRGQLYGSGGGSGGCRSGVYGRTARLQIGIDITVDILFACGVQNVVKFAKV